MFDVGKTMPKCNKTDKMEDYASTRRAVRKAHFAAGGTPTMWLRPGSVMKDPRKEASRKACRGRISFED